MNEYTASVPVYVDGVYVEAGRPFTTSQPKGSTWTRADGQPDPVKAPEPEPAPEPVARPDQEQRDRDIAAVLDLLGPDDLVKTGGRAGAPKCSAVENIVGYPVFTDEVDAAWIARAPQ